MVHQKGPQQTLTAFHRRRVWIKRIVVFGVIVTLGILRLWGCEKGRTGPSGEDDFSRYNGQTFTCTKVVDGDTVDINLPDLKAQKPRAYTRIRMWGIDTPEISHFGKPAMYYGYEAAEFARKLLAGKKIRLGLVEGDTRDKFGRLLAYIYLPDGRMYNELAVREGYAYAEVRFKHPNRESFIKSETEARKDLRGLWSGITPDQLPKWYKPAWLAEFWNSRPQTRPATPPEQPAQLKKIRKHKTLAPTD
jgi:micrococcal nuclease